MRTIRNFLFLLMLLSLAACASAQEVRVAAASDLQFAMKDLATKYEKSTGRKVGVSYGSSGNFRTQIANGAPFDLFFSADVQYPNLLITAGLADAETLYIYAHGRLVLWAPAGSNLQLAQRGFEVLKDPRVSKVAIANPEHAPYGRAAVAALQKAGLYDAVKSKLVYGENISQAAQFAESGSAQVGVLALSLTFAESMKNGERWEVPQDLYPPLEQAAVVIHASGNKAAATAFLDYVKSAEGKEVLAKYGFTTDSGGSAGAGAQKP
jgi:molybdate transport system substrate-binding protein